MVVSRGVDEILQDDSHLLAGSKFGELVMVNYQVGLGCLLQVDIQNRSHFLLELIVYGPERARELIFKLVL